MINIIRKSSFFLFILLVSSSCSSYKFSVKSVSYENDIKKVSNIRILPVQVESDNVLKSGFGNVFKKFISFSLEENGFKVVTSTDLNAIDLSIHIRNSKRVSGIDEVHSSVLDILLKNGDKVLVHIFSIYEGAESLESGLLMQKVVNKLALKIKNEIGKAK